MNLTRAAALWALLFSSSSIAFADEIDTPVVLVHARVIPTVGKSLEDAAIVIEAGRFADVGVGIAIPPNARIIDATGLIVYPGFIDAGAHVGITRDEPTDEQRARVEDEIPDVRQGPQSATVQAYRRLMHPDWHAEDLIDMSRARSAPSAAPAAGGRGGGGRGMFAEASPATSDPREGHRKAGFTTALVSPKPAIFAGQSALVQMGSAPLRRSILKAGFAQHAAFVTGTNPDVFDPSMFDRPRYPTTTMGAIAAFRQILMDADWHRQVCEWARRHPSGERPPLDRDLEALWPVLAGQVPTIFIANSENEIHRALDAAAEFHLKPIISGAREGWKVAERLKREKVPVILSLKWSEEPKLKEKPKKEEGGSTAASQAVTTSDQPSTGAKEPPTSPSPVLASRRPIFDDEWESQPFEPQRMFEERKRLWAEEVDNARRLAEAGVRFAIGSFEMKSAGDVLKNLRSAIARGLPGDVALAALTFDAAEMLGQSGQLGEIAPGQIASLSVLSKPLADDDGKVQWVFVEGEQFDLTRGDGGEGDRGDGKGPRGRRDGAGAPDRKKRGVEPSGPSTSAAATNSQPAVEFPDFTCEIEADRKPTLQTGGSVLIRGAILITVSGDDLSGADLLVRGGRIEAIGPNLAAPAGVKVLDLKGYFVSPGIIDPHSHICSDGGLNEFSLSVTCEVRVRDVIDHTSISAFRALAGGVTAVHTMHGSANAIGGQNAVLRLKYGRPAAEWLVAEAPRTVKFALGENVKQSNSDRRSRGTRFPNTRAGVEAVMRRSFDAAREYRAGQAAFAKATAEGKDPRPVRRDLRLEALASILEGDIWVHSHCYRADEILRLLSVAEDYGFRIGVLQHVLEGYRLIPEMHRHGAAASTFSDWWAYKIEAYDAIPFNAARLEQGGVVTTVNSDSPEVMRHLSLEAAKSLHFGGLNPKEAMRLCTLNGAIQLGIDKEVGSLEIGKRADLAIFDAHPLDTFARCVMTLIDGEVYFQHSGLNLADPAPARPARRFAEPRAALAVPQSPGGVYRLSGARVFPVSGPPLDQGIVDIADGRIVQVSGGASNPPPAGAVVLDCKGLEIYPGLIDAASPLGLTEIGSVQGTIDTSEIAEYQPDVTAVSAFNPFSAEVEVARCEGVLSAHIVQGGGAISGRSGVVKLDGWSMPEALVRSEVGVIVSLPSLPVEFPPSLPEERQREARQSNSRRLGEVEDFFRDAAHYSDATLAAAARRELAPRRDPRLEAMIPYVRGERPVFFAADSYKQIREALRFADRYRLRPIILGGRESWKLAEDLAARNVDVIFSRPSTLPADKFEPWDSVYRTPAMLYAAGVRFCLGVRDASLSKQLGVEAGLAVAHGLDEAAALQAITLDAARILGVEDRLGSIQKGRLANLIITTGTPLQADTRVVAAFVEGRPIELTSRHTRHDAQWQARPNPRLPPAPELRGPPAMRRR